MSNNNLFSFLSIRKNGGELRNFSSKDLSFDIEILVHFRSIQNTLKFPYRYTKIFVCHLITDNLLWYQTKIWTSTNPDSEQNLDLYRSWTPIPQLLRLWNATLHWDTAFTTLHWDKYQCMLQSFQNKNKGVRMSWIDLWYHESSRTFEIQNFKSYFGQLKTPRSCWRNKPVDDLPCFHNPSRPGPYLFSESEIIFGLGAVAKNLKHWSISKISIFN